MHYSGVRLILFLVILCFVAVGKAQEDKQDVVSLGLKYRTGSSKDPDFNMLAKDYGMTVSYARGNYGPVSLHFEGGYFHRMFSPQPIGDSRIFSRHHYLEGILSARIFLEKMELSEVFLQTGIRTQYAMGTTLIDYQLSHSPDVSIKHLAFVAYPEFGIGMNIRQRMTTKARLLFRINYATMNEFDNIDPKGSWWLTSSVEIPIIW